MYKKITYLILCFILISFVSISQDIVYKKDGTKIECKVTEIHSEYISYTTEKEGNTKVFTLQKSDILMVGYQNGSYEVFSLKENTDRLFNSKTDFKQNVLSFHFMDILYNDFTISYERIKKDGMLGISVPLGIGFNHSEEGYGDYANVIYSGIGLNFYPVGQGVFSFFFGPNLKIGKAQTYEYNFTEDMLILDQNFLITKLHISPGVVYNPVESFSISAVGSVGIKYYNTDIDNFTRKGTYKSGHFSILISYRI